MTRQQKLVTIFTFLLIALFLHIFLCDWKREITYMKKITFNGEVTYSGNTNYNNALRERIIVPLGTNFRIVGRSRETIATDGILGIAIPILLIGSSLFVIVTPGRCSQQTSTNNISKLKSEQE